MTYNALLKCNLKEGMFPSEYAVSIQTISDDEVGFFCPKDLILDEKLEVQVIERLENRSLIRLPVESFSSSTFIVSNDLLSMNVVAA